MNKTNYGYSKNITGIDTSIVERSNAITTEIKRSKQVLDATLSAYSQLQMAWKLHVKYIDIYNALVKYRDALVKVRKQTDQFPKDESYEQIDKQGNSFNEYMHDIGNNRVVVVRYESQKFFQIICGDKVLISMVDVLF